MWDFILKNKTAFQWTVGIIFVVVLIALIWISNRFEKRQGKQQSPIQKMTMLSVLGALSAVLYYFPKLPFNAIFQFMPGFLDLHLSNVPILELVN